MQVSAQVGGSQLSLWFAFCKQYVRDGSKDGEQSDFLIISTVFQNTVLIEESLRMHLSVKGRIFEAALFITPDLRTQLRKWISITCCLKKGAICSRSGFEMSGCICYTLKRKFQLDRETTDIPSFVRILVILTVIIAIVLLRILLMVPSAFLASSCSFGLERPAKMSALSDIVSLFLFRVLFLCAVGSLCELWFRVWIW